MFEIRVANILRRSKPWTVFLKFSILIIHSAGTIPEWAPSPLLEYPGFAVAFRVCGGQAHPRHRQ